MCRFIAFVEQEIRNKSHALFYMQNTHFHKVVYYCHLVFYALSEKVFSKDTLVKGAIFF